MSPGAHRLARLTSAALALVVAVALATGAPAQSPEPAQPSSGTVSGAGSGTPAPPAGPDYAAWDRAADNAEAAVSDPEVGSEALEAIRAEIAGQRQAFEAAQTVNSARIATVQEQLSALGNPPAEGQSEAPEIAARRAALTSQIEELQVPGLTASEAYRRADGIIREIDRILRERQADELLRLWPTPLNPANWPAGLAAIAKSWDQTRAETASALAKPEAVSTLLGRLPAILVLCVIGLGLILRGALVMNRGANWLRSVVAARWLKVVLPLVSFGKIMLPVLGLMLLAAAAQRTEVLGPKGLSAIGGLVMIGLATLMASWLGAHIFPVDASTVAPVRLGQERRAEGRFLSRMLGLMVGLESFRGSIYGIHSGDAAASTLAFPALLVAGLLLLRLGQLLRLHLATVADSGATPHFQDRMIGLLGQAATVLGFVGPVLGAIGYIPAALAIVYPAAITLGVLAMVYILQGLVEDVYDALTGRTEAEGGALVPVLIGFVLALAALPVLALVWGARLEYLGELWVAFSRGFSIGETRISPSAFVVLALVFGVGFAATRLLQAALRSSILPRTRLDQGGQNAILAGFGYIGIFISGLIAVHAAGINLAGLALVAGALSLGIGFGLKNIVENFVSGIILLVERPVSEGDWIEVGGLQGTVQSISVRSTRIQTFDRSDVIVPNADLVSGRVTNFTRFNLSGRLIVPVSVSHDADTRKVEQVLREIAEAEPLALVNPPPLVVLMDFGADAINFEIRLILSDVNFSLSVRSEMNHEILRRFREEGIDIPFPQREVWVHSGGAELPAPKAPSSRPRPPRAAPVRDEAVLDLHASDNDGDANDR
jgi:potassium-dependent mechanosensitive channel